VVLRGKDAGADEGDVDRRHFDLLSRNVYRPKISDLRLKMQGILVRMQLHMWWCASESCQKCDDGIAAKGGQSARRSDSVKDRRTD
jgi:hypothetical protein